MAVTISEISVSVNSDCTVISKYNLYAGKNISTFPSTSNKGENRKKEEKAQAMRGGLVNLIGFCHCRFFKVKLSSFWDIITCTCI